MEAAVLFARIDLGPAGLKVTSVGLAAPGATVLLLERNRLLHEMLDGDVA